MLEVIRGHACWHEDVILILAVADWTVIISGGWQHKIGFSVTVDIVDCLILLHACAESPALSACVPIQLQCLLTTSQTLNVDVIEHRQDVEAPVICTAS